MKVDGGSIFLRHNSKNIPDYRIVTSRKAPQKSAEQCARETNKQIKCTMHCGDRVHCSNTIAEEAGLIAVRDVPDLCLCTSRTVPSASNLS
jgi:hypothetical protein